MGFNSGFKGLSNPAFRCSEYFCVFLWGEGKFVAEHTKKAYLSGMAPKDRILVNVLTRVDGFLPRGLYSLGKYPRGIELIPLGVWEY